MAKGVTYTNKAFADIDRIIEFNNLRNQSKAYSKKFLANLRKRLPLLNRYPLTGVETDDPDTLLLIWDDYYIFYEPNEGFIEVSAIYHQKENITR